MQGEEVMFKTQMANQLKRIFEFDKVTFAIPGESEEQEGLFINVENAQTCVKDARQIARVTGKIHVFAQLNKLPYGYFSKCLAEAELADKSGFFFYDFEENKGTFQNIVERTLSFVYLFDSQYDPAIGTLNEVNLSFAES